MTTELQEAIEYLEYLLTTKFKANYPRASSHFPALISALREREWRPMDSAPRDGTAILAKLPDSDLYAVVRFKGGVWRIAWDGWIVCDQDTPTHWQPLPEGPAS